MGVTGQTALPRGKTFWSFGQGAPYILAFAAQHNLHVLVVHAVSVPVFVVLPRDTAAGHRGPVWPSELSPPLSSSLLFPLVGSRITCLGGAAFRSGTAKKNARGREDHQLPTPVNASAPSLHLNLDSIVLCWVSVTPSRGPVGLETNRCELINLLFPQTSVNLSREVPQRILH